MRGSSNEKATNPLSWLPCAKAISTPNATRPCPLDERGRREALDRTSWSGAGVVGTLQRGSRPGGRRGHDPGPFDIPAARTGPSKDACGPRSTIDAAEVFVADVVTGAVLVPGARYIHDRRRRD